MGIDKEALTRLSLTEEEYLEITKRLGEEPDELALSIFAALWSEHCSYKHSKRLLRKYFNLFPRRPGNSIIAAQAHENAGAIRLDDDNWVIMKIESHNHPSAIEPYQGAATGVGGIVRDVLTLGARPIALLNSLRFGDLENTRSRHHFRGVISGVGGYGNCLGIPDVGGEIFFNEAYNHNPLVNVMCVGLFKQSESKLKWYDRDQQMEHLMSPFSARPLPKRLEQRPVGSALILFGSQTGRDGIQGASFASAVLDDIGEDRRPAVQIGDPFKEKLLIEACLELSKLDVVEGLQDLGAAGLAGAAIEYADRRGLGVEIDVSAVPMRETGMSAQDVMVSESQERMLVIVRQGCESVVTGTLEKWGLDYNVVGHLISHRGSKPFEVIIKDGEQEEVLERIRLSAITDSPLRDGNPAASEQVQGLQNHDLSTVPLPSSSPSIVLLSLLASPNIASKESVFRQYDHQVQNNTVIGPGGDAAVLRIRGVTKGLAVTTDGNSRYCYLDPYTGGLIAVAEACRNLACVGATPVAVTDCLNFGNPERSEIFYQLEESIRGIADACKKFYIPVVSGNVSLYNETDGVSIYPTPIIGALGLLEDVKRHSTPAFKESDAVIMLLGCDLTQIDIRELGGSEYLEFIHGLVVGRPAIDLELEGQVHELCRRAIIEGIVASAHDCSDGGLAVTLAECCILGNIGFQSNGILSQVPERWDVALFGERQSRIVVSLAREQRPALERLAADLGVPLLELGVTGGTQFRIGQYIDLSVQELDDAWSNGLERALMG